MSADICVKCHNLFLDCSKPGAEIHSASPLPNYTRLGNESRAYKCMAPASRCNANLSDPLSQVKVYPMKVFVVNISMFPCFDVSWSIYSLENTGTFWLDHKSKACGMPHEPVKFLYVDMYVKLERGQTFLGDT